MKILIVNLLLMVSKTILLFVLFMNNIFHSVYALLLFGKTY